ncbi:MAG: hypothetical protein KGS00_03430 [Alphaproteobacteria bacterium]|nr:hypothetical protein [Alphaproteobacteria bacterium]
MTPASAMMGHRFSWVIGACGIALGACQPAEEISSPAVSPSPLEETAPLSPDAASPPAAGEIRMKPVVFQPVGEPAASATGALSLTAIRPALPDAAPAMSLETQTGLRYQTELAQGGVGLTDDFDWTALFAIPPAQAKASPSALSVDVHKVTGEISGASDAPGLCGARPVRMLAIVTPVEGPDGGRQLRMAVFSADGWPPEDIGGLCGVFAYALPG